MNINYMEIITRFGMLSEAEKIKTIAELKLMIPRKKLGRKPTPPEVTQEIHQLLKEGKSNKQIIARIGICKTTFFKIKANLKSCHEN